MNFKPHNSFRDDREPTGLPGVPENIYLGIPYRQFDIKRILFIILGVSLFLVVNFSKPWSDAIDPTGKSFSLTIEGKAALGLFLWAVVWWVSEVVPIGVTGIVIGVVQVLFLIRPAGQAFGDFMDPSVWFVIGSIMIGTAFAKTGLTKRLAYKMLMIVGENTRMIYLGCFLMTAALSLIIAHTAVAAAVYPILMAVHGLYGQSNKPTNFGTGLFIGMAFVAGAGSVITLLGAARGAVAIGFFRDITGREINFFELSYYMMPLGVIMVLLLWLLITVMFKPEKKTIVGMHQRVVILNSRLGTLSSDEKLTLIIVFLCVALLSLRSFIPLFEPLNKSAIILTSTVLFFVFKILSIEDLQKIPWNIVLLFGGAMSIGFCMWQTGAASWLAIKWLNLFKESHWFVFVMGLALFVMVMTNLIMNVAAIAITLPVGLVIAPYMNLAPEVILFSALAAAGMPFLLLVGAAPNAIAYESKMFSTTQFFKAGIPASIMLLIVIALFIKYVWRWLGMPIFVG